MPKRNYYNQKSPLRLDKTRKFDFQLEGLISKSAVFVCHFLLGMAVAQGEVRGKAQGFVLVEGLGDVGVHPGLHRHLLILLVRVGAHGKDGDATCVFPGQGADAARGVKAIELQPGDEVVGLVRIDPDGYILTVTEQGKNLFDMDKKFDDVFSSSASPSIWYA